MQLKTADLKKLLENYHYYKIEIENGLSSKEIINKIQFVDNCIKLLDEESRKIITKIYFDKQNKLYIAKELFIDRTTLFRRNKKILDRLSEAYNNKFKSCNIDAT